MSKRAVGILLMAIVLVCAVELFLYVVGQIPEAHFAQEDEVLEVSDISAANAAKSGATTISSAGPRLADRVYAGNNLEEDTPTILCWGDSLTEGIGASRASIDLGDGMSFDASYLSYPQVLNQLTGYQTCNFGVSGATSLDVAIMAGALEGALSLSERDLDAALVETLAPQYQGGILILEMGSNGGWDEDYATLISQYQAIIQKYGCKDFIIIGDTDDPGLSVDSNQLPFEAGDGPGETDLEAALRKAFGSHFINMRVYLIEHGLENAGLEETRLDVLDASYGCISQQLRDDWTHLNSYGYYAKACGVYQKGVELGYWG